MDNQNSFHGKLLSTVVNKWAEESLFEPNNDTIKESLNVFLENYTPSIDYKVEWNNNISLIDSGKAGGRVFFIDENENERVLDFIVTATGTNIQ